VVLAVAVIGGATYWWLNRGLVSTDDAFVDGNAVTLSPRSAARCCGFSSTTISR
jgi:membrane fusion protein (multidrug efflux system)